MASSSSSSSSLIGVTGASGKLGGSVVRQLLAASISPSRIIALIRSPHSDKGKALTIQGVVVRELDYNKPSTIESALNGISTLLLVSSNGMNRAADHENVLNGAVAAGIPRVVYTSILHSEATGAKLAVDHVITEKLLKKLFLRYTVLRNGWYTENEIGAIHGALAQGAFVGGAGEGKLSTASIDDFAAAAVAVLTSSNPSEHDGKTYELAGDSAFTYAEFAAELSKQSGKQIPYKNLAEAEYVELLKKVGLPPYLAEGLADAAVASSKGALFDNGGQLSKLIGRPTTPWAVTIKNVLASVQK